MTTDKSHAERARKLADEITKLSTEATPGPWRVIPDPGEIVGCDDCGSYMDTGDFPHMIARGPEYGSSIGLALVITDDKEDANAAFIARARTALPESAALLLTLADRVEKLEASLERIRVALEWYADRNKDALGIAWDDDAAALSPQPKVKP